MKKYFLALTPEKKLNDKITLDKERVLEKIGNQLYLKDIPHTTLYVSQTNDIDKIVSSLKKFVDVYNKQSNLFIDISGWKLFLNDVVTGKNAIAFNFTNESTVKLKIFQIELIGNLIAEKAIYTSKDELHPRYADIEKFNSNEKKAIINRGYPFIGESWHPHISICCTTKANIDVIKKIVPIANYIGERSKLNLKVFELIDDVPNEVFSVALN